MTTEHASKHFEQDLKRLDNIMAEMGGLAEAQLADAMDVMLKRDEEKALVVVAGDERIDALAREVEELTVSMLAVHQPMAEDLRTVIAALRAASVIERIGDYAKNIAKRTVALSQAPPVGPTKTIARMGALVQRMIKNVLDAYVSRDADMADDVRNSDEEVDALYTSLFRELLTYMMEDPRNITSCTHLLFVAKNIERIGDHATNVAQNVQFLVSGRAPAGKRTKSDASSYTVIEPANDSPDRPPGDDR
ncbi:MAG: phosphate signaling complex protein PhoU [Rhodospirillales bacterium]